MVKGKNEPDYCRDSFENFVDNNGHVRWIEAPKWRIQVSGSSAYPEQDSIRKSDYLCLKPEDRWDCYNPEIGEGDLDIYIDGMFPENRD